MPCLGLHPSVKTPCDTCYGEFGRARWFVTETHLYACDHCAPFQNGVEEYAPEIVTVRRAFRLLWVRWKFRGYKLCGKWRKGAHHWTLLSAPAWKCLLKKLLRYFFPRSS